MPSLLRLEMPIWLSTLAPAPRTACYWGPSLWATVTTFATAATTATSAANDMAIDTADGPVAPARGAVAAELDDVAPVAPAPAGEADTGPLRN